MWAIPPRPRTWPGWRWGAALLALALYLAAFALLFPALGVSVLLLSALPVAVVAWWGGPRAGLLGGLLATPLNALLLALAGPQSQGTLGPFLLLNLFVILAGGGVARLAALQGHRRPPTDRPAPDPTHHPPTGDAVLTVDDDLRVLTFNQAAEDVFLLPAEAVVGQPLDRIIVGGLAERLRAFERGQAPDLPAGLQQGHGLRPGGERFPLAASVAPGQADGQPCFTLTVHDLSARHHPEAVLLGQQELLEMIARGAPLPAVLEAAVRFLESLSQGTLGAVLLLDNDAQTLRLGAGPALPDGLLQALDGLSTAAGGHPCAAAVQRAQPVLVPDLAADPRWRDSCAYARQHGLRACWAMPIQSTGGQVLGALLVHCRAPRPPGPQELRLMAAAAHAAGIAVERQQAGQALVEERALLRTLIDNLPDYIYVKDAQGRLVLHNLADAAHQDGAPHAAQDQADDQAVMRSGQPLLNKEVRVVDRRGNEQWLLTTKVPLRDGRGAVVGLVSVGRNITEHKLAEARLRASEAELRALLAAMTDVILVLDKDCRYVKIAPTNQALLYRPAEELLGRTLHEVFPPQQADYFATGVRRVLRTGQPTALEYVLHIEGREVWFEGVLSPLAEDRVLLVARDITDRKNAEKALRDNEQKYRLLLEQSHDAIYLVRDERVEFFNHRFEELLGVTAEDIRAPGFNLLDYVAPCDRPMIEERLRKRQQGRVHELSDRYEFNVLRKDGQQVAVEVSISYFPYGDGYATQGIVRDITLRKQAEAAEREGRALAEALHDTATAISSTLELDEVLDRILASVERVVPHDVAEIMLIEDGIARIVRARGYTEEEHAQVTALRLPVASTPNLQAMAASGQALAIPDIDAYPGWRWELPLHWFRSYTGAPISVQDQVIGFLSLVSRTRGFFTEAHAQRLQAFADQAAIAIQNARLFAESRRRAEELEALRRVTLDITTQMDLPTLLEALVRSAFELLGTDSGGMYLYRPERDVLEWAVAIGPHTVPTGMTLRRGEGLSGKVWESGQPLIINDYSAWEGRAPQYDNYGFRAVLGVPVRWQDELLGVINATTAGTSRHAFTEHHARLLSLFADQAAIAIKNARLLEQAQRHAAELEERVAERTAEIRAQQERITAILDSVADAVVVTDLQGQVVLANPVARWLLEVESTGPTLRQRIADLAAQLAHHPQVTRTDIIEVGRMTYQAKAAKVLEAGQDLGQVIVLRDITRLQELDRLKSQFVNTVSHELRTPLTNFKLYLSLLERGMAERREEYLAVLQRETARLERLISNLLDLSRLEETRHVTRRQPLDLTGLVAQVVETHLPQAQEKQLTLSYRPADQPLPPLWGDRDELVQMLTNLVANALAYTPPGGCVEVSSRPGTMLDAQSGAAIIEVRDTGIGIAEQDMLHIFDRFYRGANTVHGEVPGTGLGLAITKEIVERHQGTIEVRSQLGQGSTFRVFLPLLSPDHSRLEFGGGADA